MLSSWAYIVLSSWTFFKSFIFVKFLFNSRRYNKRIKRKNNKLRKDLNNISNQFSKEEENYTKKLNDLEDKRRKYADLQKNMSSLIKDGEKASDLLNNKIQQLSEIKLNIQKIKAENEKKKNRSKRI